MNCATPAEPGRLSKENIIAFLEEVAKLLQDHPTPDDTYCIIPNWMRLAMGDKRQRRRFRRNAGRRMRTTHSDVETIGKSPEGEKQ